MPTAATYPVEGVDIALMYERDRLELHWRNVLTEQNRNAWLTYWDTHPPQDAYGRRYILSVPTAWDELQVLPSTAFAWQNIFATFRFGAAIVDTPSTRSVPTVAAFEFHFNVDAQIFVMRTNPVAVTPARILYYASKTHYPLHGDGAQRCRPLTGEDLADLNSTRDLTAAYLYRFGSWTTGEITAGVVLLDNNNAAAPTLLWRTVHFDSA